MNDSFFSLKEKSLFSRGTLEAKLECEKQDSTITIDYVINGFVNIECERCLEEIELQVDTKHHEVLKLTGNTELLKEENYLSVNHQIFSCYDTLYEQICLALPLRKICENSNAKRKCELDYSSDDVEKPTDDRWEKLKNLIK